MRDGGRDVIACQANEGEVFISNVQMLPVLHLQLILIKYLDQVLWYEFIKAL